VSLLNRGPDRRQIADIGLQVGFGDAVASRSDDESEVLGAEPLDDFAQPPSLFIGTDST